MDVREKLAELLKTNACPSPFICDQACKYYGYGDCFPDRFADYLIANGVTVQEWISVKDRVPEKNKEVVGWYKDNPFSPFRYGIVYWNGHGWVFTYAQRYVDAVTYWMPLPEPPKEETT